MSVTTPEHVWLCVRHIWQKHDTQKRTFSVFLLIDDMHTNAQLCRDIDALLSTMTPKHKRVQFAGRRKKRTSPKNTIKQLLITLLMTTASAAATTADQPSPESSWTWFTNKASSIVNAVADNPVVIVTYPGELAYSGVTHGLAYAYSSVTHGLTYAYSGVTYGLDSVVGTADEAYNVAPGCYPSHNTCYYVDKDNRRECVLHYEQLSSGIFHIVWFLFNDQHETKNLGETKTIKELVTSPNIVYQYIQQQSPGLYLNTVWQVEIDKTSFGGYNITNLPNQIRMYKGSELTITVEWTTNEIDVTTAKKLIEIFFLMPTTTYPQDDTVFVRNNMVFTIHKNDKQPVADEDQITDQSTANSLNDITHHDVANKTKNVTNYIEGWDVTGLQIKNATNLQTGDKTDAVAVVAEPSHAEDARHKNTNVAVGSVFDLEAIKNVLHKQEIDDNVFITWIIKLPGVFDKIEKQLVDLGFNQAANKELFLQTASLNVDVPVTKYDGTVSLVKYTDTFPRLIKFIKHQEEAAIAFKDVDANAYFYTAQLTTIPLVTLASFWKLKQWRAPQPGQLQLSPPKPSSPPVNTPVERPNENSLSFINVENAATQACIAALTCAHAKTPLEKAACAAQLHKDNTATFQNVYANMRQDGRTLTDTLDKLLDGEHFPLLFSKSDNPWERQLNAVFLQIMTCGLNTQNRLFRTSNDLQKKKFNDKLATFVNERVNWMFVKADDTKQYYKFHESALKQLTLIYPLLHYPFVHKEADLEKGNPATVKDVVHNNFYMYNDFVLKYDKPQQSAASLSGGALTP
jgi:hypothetical protein